MDERPTSLAKVEPAAASVIMAGDPAVPPCDRLSLNMSILGLDLLEGVIGGVGGEVDIDDFVSEQLVSSFNGIDAALHEVLVDLVESHLQVAGAVQANTLSLSDDVAGQHQIVKDSFVHGGQSAAVGSLLALAELSGGSLYLDPAGLDGAGNHQQDGGPELLLKLDVQFLGVVVQRLLEVEGHEHDDDWLLPLILRNLELDGFGELETLDFGDGTLDFVDGSSDGGLQRGQILHFSKRLPSVACRIVLGPCWWDMVIYR